ncbi:Hypothetical protein A7982_08277 [Minicystis rosea]|nr:Hypothetical protein A7982_08277 [Minicystis rosea]
MVRSLALAIAVERSGGEAKKSAARRHHRTLHASSADRVGAAVFENGSDATRASSVSRDDGCVWDRDRAANPEGIRRSCGGDQ